MRSNARAVGTPRTLEPRLRLDLSTSDLLAGLIACLVARNPDERGRRVELAFTSAGDAMCGLSVRSLFDAFLAEVDWPPGSEILVSALTIPDMVRIAIEHGYLVRPVDIDPETLVPPLAVLTAACTPRTVAWLHAHLFGTVADLSEHTAALAQRGVVLLDDCAQAYTGGPFRGSPGAFASFFSFGTIKTATALGGGLVRIADPEVRSRVRSRVARWPREPRLRRIVKVIRAHALVALGHPWIYAQLVAWLERGRRDPDEWVHAASRSFRGPDFFDAIRHRPSSPLLALLERRLRHAPRTETRVAQRRATGRAVQAEIHPTLAVLGGRSMNSHWVFAITVADPHRVRADARAAGFDATSRSSLTCVGEPHRCPNARVLLETVVYLPLGGSEDASTRSVLVSTILSAVDHEVPETRPTGAAVIAPTR